ncbi:MAG: Por secretion system protein, partial [Prevotella sp.]|nr:Por secretion system protein [Prevotella sp.]
MEKYKKGKGKLWHQSLLLLFFILSPLHLFTFSPLFAQVGTWRNHLAYAEVQNICAADHDLFVLASNDLYQYNQNDQSIVTYDKTNGLSDTNITHIAWNPQAKRLIIIYQNSNIDLIDVLGNTINISALYNRTMTEDKTVNKITIDGIYAWLHCAFGYVKVNMQRAEITDTYTPNHPEYPTSLPEYNEKKDLAQYQATVSTLNPGGPKYNHFYESKFYNGKLYTTGGFFLSGMNDPIYPGTVQVFDGNDWTIFEDELNNRTGYQYVDNNCIDIDPMDDNHVMVGGRTGLYEFQNGMLKNYYNKDNSPLKGAIDGKNELDNHYVIVNSIKYDSEGNLWVLNSQAKNTNLLELTKDGTWNNHFKSSLQDNKETGLTGLRSMFFDSRDLLWFVNTSWLDPSVMCYDKSSDQLIKYTNFVNQDGTTNHPTYIYCVCEDKEHNIWVGTNIGPFMINSSEVGQESVVFNQIKVPRNDGTNYADYLLNGVYINHIAIDGGNRKWFSTNGAGVFLVSADNMTQIANFTKDNSRILSNDILSTAINQQSGEVFFLADNGLSSYFSDATEPSDEMTDDTVWAYPNPVTPDYTGLITVTGLSFDADVKITSSNGALIAEGRSNGGMFTWDGCDKKGRRVASGVYMVITATSD